MQKLKQVLEEASVGGGMYSTKYNYPLKQKQGLILKQLSAVKTVATRLSNLKDDNISLNDEALIHLFYDKLTEIRGEMARIKR